jgi:hypothetical protein
MLGIRNSVSLLFGCHFHITKRRELKMARFFSPSKTIRKLRWRHKKECSQFLVVPGVLKKPVPVPGTGIDLPPVPVSVFSGIYIGSVFIPAF